MTMSSTRACRPCRSAKIKCDLREPECGACIRRGVRCNGYPSRSQFLFRDQNETARVNSERARRHGVQRMDSTTISLPDSETTTNEAVDQTALIYRKAMPWLNERALASIPSSPSYSLQERARDIFYFEWILHPSNHGASPGYMDMLPTMVALTSDTSALQCAVDAFAFANIYDFTIKDGNLRQMAARKYGEALGRIRKSIATDDLASSDSDLLAILTIDMFEVVFLNRDDSLGLHSRAIEHILTLRGTRNVYSQTTFSLYRMAHHRLQSRQITLGNEPLPVQLDCIQLINTSEAALDLGGILLTAQEGLRLSQDLPVAEPSGSAEEQVLAITRRINQSLAGLELWSQRIPPSWNPRHVQVSEDEDIKHILSSASLPEIPQVLIYHDPWIAYQMNFFYTGQIALRSALIDTLAWTADVTRDADRSKALKEEIEIQQNEIVQSSDALIESIPMLICSAEPHVSREELCPGKKIGQCFAQAACWTLQQKKYVLPEHKDFADKTLLWLQKLRSLDGTSGAS